MAKIASGASQGTPAARGSASAHGADPPAAAGAARARGLRRPLRQGRLAAPIALPSPEDELLVRAGELVARGWCREALAEDALGRRVDPWSRTACRWTPLGALARAWCEGGANRIEAFATAYLALSLAVGGTVADWNAAPWRTKHHATAALARARERLSSAREYERALRRDHEHRADRLAAV